MTVNLRQHCLAGGSHPVSSGGDCPLTVDDLAARSLALAAALAACPEQRWGLWFTDATDFLSGFFALALAGKDIVMPHNMQAQSARQISAHFDALLTDSPQPLAVKVYTPAQLPAAAGDFTAHTDSAISLTLFTSGSTGEPAAIVKSLALLEAELAVLQQCFGEQVETFPVLSTVSHQHIYGLLHKLLWPLWRRAPVITESCQYPEELAALAGAHAPVVLVSSPTHLARLPASPAFAGGTKALQAIFSSGGLLPTDAALALHRLTGVGVVEVLGSTETGGVAWRVQSQGSLWQPLPGVQVAADDQSGCLSVWSRHLGSSAPFVMGDKVAFEGEGRFQLRGRADQVVKVEGKRLSLTEMEQRLAEHPLVAEVRLAVVRTRRDQVGAVLVLTPAGEAQLALGKRALNDKLREHLQAYFERPLLPRRWRYVPALPRNPQGKVLAADIQALLLVADSGEPPKRQG